MVNRAGNEKAQELCLLSFFSPCSVAPPWQVPCLLWVALFLQKMCGPYTQWPVAQVQIFSPLPREMHMRACQTTRADCLSSENTVTVLICNYVYVFFSFVDLNRPYYPLVKQLEIKKSMYIITKVKLFPNASSRLPAIINNLIFISNIY